MENLRNKSQNLKSKDYFKRFTNLNIYSYTKPDDKKIYIGAKPNDVYTLFNGNTSSLKKEVNVKNLESYDKLNIDQSVLQYYIILALQDFHNNYYLPLVEENNALKADIDKLKLTVNEVKHKNNNRFDYVLSKLHKYQV